MREFSLTEQFALAGLNGQDSKHNTAAKKAVIKGIRMAEFLERLIENNAGSKKDELSERMAREIQKIHKLNKKEREEIEEGIVKRLKDKGALTEVPDILGCDINYYTASVSMWEYKCAESIYQHIVEFVRAETLEDGDISIETVCLLYLFRESGCVHDIFSVKEQEYMNERLIDCMSKDSFCQTLLNTEFHGLENMYLGFLKRKQEMFQNPYLQGVNLLFPFLERRQAIFIDMVVLGTNVAERRTAVMDFVRKRGHTVESVEFGEEHLLKIDNSYYRIFPTTRTGYRIPIQGISIIPVYM